MPWRGVMAGYWFEASKQGHDAWKTKHNGPTTECCRRLLVAAAPRLLRGIHSSLSSTEGAKRVRRLVPQS
jgi:hypothetical protein